MSYNSNCAYQTCQRGCCNFYGYCPEDYDQAHYSNYYTTCYHYYEDKNSPSDYSFALYLLGGLALLSLLLLCYWRRNRTSPSLSISKFY